MPVGGIPVGVIPGAGYSDASGAGVVGVPPIGGGVGGGVAATATLREPGTPAKRIVARAAAAAEAVRMGEDFTVVGFVGRGGGSF
jgi:hypothetical protein